MKDFGGCSFVTKGADYKSAIKIVEKLKIFTLAESLGVLKVWLVILQA